MDHPRIDDERVIDRYLRRELSPADEELFEEHLFACAGCLEQVNSGEALRQGLRAVAAEEGARAAISRGLLSLGLFAWLRGRGPGPRVALAALALALVALPGWMLLRQRADLVRLRAAVARDAFAGPIADLLVVTLGEVRSAGSEEVEVRLDPGKRAVLLSLELPPAAAVRYRAVLYDAEGRMRWQGEGLEPNLYGTLLIVVPSAFLTPGSYQVRLEALSAHGAEPAGAMRFRIVRGERDER